MTKLTPTTVPATHWLVRHDGWSSGFVGIVLHGTALISSGKCAWPTKDEALADAREQERRFGQSKMPGSIRQRYAYDR